MELKDFMTVVLIGVQLMVVKIGYIISKPYHTKPKKFTMTKCCQYHLFWIMLLKHEKNVLDDISYQGMLSG